ALNDMPVEVPPGTPVVADKGHDSDSLRDEMEDADYTPVIPHRKGRVKPSRNDGRRLRRYRHRWLVERTNAWLECYRGLAVRWAYPAARGKCLIDRPDKNDGSATQYWDLAHAVRLCPSEELQPSEPQATST